MPTLSTTRTYAAGQVLRQSDLDGALDSIETAANDTKWGTDNLQNSSVTTDIIADGALSADTSGRLKMADGYLTDLKLADDARVPAGVVLPFAGTVAPTGYLMCDGSAVSRTTYARLFAAIGIAHGWGDNSTTFNLPNINGRFIRGVDGTAGNDPDAASRTAAATGGNTGNAVGSVQGHAYQTHNHGVTDTGHIHTANGASIGSGSTLVVSIGDSAVPAAAQGGVTGTVNATTGISINNASASGGTSQATSNETRPVNIYLNHIIKT